MRGGNGCVRARGRRRVRLDWRRRSPLSRRSFSVGIESNRERKVHATCRRGLGGEVPAHERAKRRQSARPSAVLAVCQKLDYISDKQGVPVMLSAAEKIEIFAKSLPEGAAINAKGLLHLGRRAAIDQALSRLAREGRLIRAARCAPSGRPIWLSPAVARQGGGSIRGAQRRDHCFKRGSGGECAGTDDPSAGAPSLFDLRPQSPAPHRRANCRVAARTPLATCIGRTPRRRRVARLSLAWS
jgi:hypothetical protein